MYAKEKKVGDLIVRASNPRSENTINTIADLLNELKDTASDKGENARTWTSAFIPRLIINRIRNKEDIEIAGRFCDIAKRYLNIKILYIGYVVEDPAIQESIKKITPFTLMRSGKSGAYECLSRITENLLQLESGKQ
jgi:MinD-like ATPase involved in chromosome partitioning or flagellar assembly